MSVERDMAVEGNTSPEGSTGGVAVAEKPSEASVLISPEAKTPDRTTTRVQELVKPPSNLWDRLRGRSNMPASPEEATVEEQTTLEPEPAAGGVGNGAEGRDGGGGDGGGSEGPGGPEIIRGPEEGETPESIVATLVKIDTLSAEPREANAEVNGQYSELLTDYANGDQAIKEDHEITTQRKQLINFDKAYINSNPDRTNPEKDALMQLLNDLDETEASRDRYRGMLNLRVEKPNLYPDLDWQEQENLLRKFEERIELLQTEIADDQFIGERTEKKAEIEARIKDIKETAKKREEDQRKQRLSEPSEEEQRWLEDHGKLEKDKQITVEESEVPSLLKFSDAWDQVKAQERLKRVNDPNFNETLYNQSKEIVGWYFQEAGRLGILFDLNEQLNSDFEEYMIGLHIQPVDERRLPPPKMTIFELRNSIRGRLDLASVIESDEAWEDLADTVRFSATRTRDQFAGVRTEYLTRGYEQMRASFTNLIHLQTRLKLQTDLIRGKITEAEYRNKVVNIARDTQQNYRVYGEWNFGFETVVRQQIERLALAEQAKPLFHETELGFIILEGENSREIELAAEQAAEFITSSAGTYSLEAVQQRREYLLRAIENKRGILSAETGGVKGETDVLVNRIKDVALNKLDFFILQWLAQYLRMPEYSSYFEQTVMQRGIDRLKVVPSMSDGLVGLAIRYLLMLEFRLYFRPGGFKNQLNESDAQTYLRKYLKQGLVDIIMGFELNDQGKGWEGKAKTLQDLMKVQSTDEFIKYFIQHKKLDSDTPDPDSQHPAERLKRAEKAYQDAFDYAKTSPDDPEALIKLREARDFRAFEQNRYQTAKNRAENAVEEAIRVMDITGESAKLGAPTIISRFIDEKGVERGTGDHINVDEATLFYKFAILQAGKDYGQNNGMEDNQALIRWRAITWRERWKKAGLDRTKALRDFKVNEKDEKGNENGNKLPVTLKEGWEETGFTEEEWTALENAVKQLKEHGYNAKLKVKVRQKDGSYKEEEMRFEDIIKRPELQPVLSNFLADYKSSKDQIQDDYLRTQSFKGRLGTLRNILLRLGIKKPTGNHQAVMNEYTQRIEDSRQFHAEIERLAYYEATHASLAKVKQQSQKLGRTIYMDSAFLEDRLEYGYQGLPWGIKRAQHRKAFEYANLRRTTPRAVDLIHAIPMSLTSLSQESASDDILNMFWDLNRFQKDDNWTLMTFAMRTKDAWYVGGRLEGDMPEQGGKLGKDWGFLEKPLLDANAMRKMLGGEGLIVGELIQALSNIKEPSTYINPHYNNLRESIIAALWDGSGGHLGRFAPIVMGAHKQLSEDRQAMGSGAGYEECEKFALRFLEWLTSEKAASVVHGDREAGGVEAYEEVKDIIRLITTPNSYTPGSSIWDEVWRKLTPGHNPRLPKAAPEPTYPALAA